MILQSTEWFALGLVLQSNVVANKIILLCIRYQFQKKTLPLIVIIMSVSSHSKHNIIELDNCIDGVDFITLNHEIAYGTPDVVKL